LLDVEIAGRCQRPTTPHVCKTRSC